MSASRNALAAAVGLWVTQFLPAQEPAPINLPPPQRTAPSTNQQIADTIADRLRQSGQLHGYAVDVGFRDGTAVLQGTIADQLQRDQAVRVVAGVPGVEHVTDQLILVGAVAPAQHTESTLPAPEAMPPGAVAAGPGPVEPMPVYQASPSQYDLNPPKMPPYAWPTYAPYNNYSRVAYPNLYPHNAWPFIGPIYPYPKIPLGWRKVQLEWQDGYWWYSTHSTSHDWWRLRYW